MTAALSSPPGIVPGLTRAWVKLYCTGMSPDRRALRLLEIESDLWEHFADGAAHGKSAAATSTEAFSRLLRGVPSDIAWRFQAEGFQMNIQFPLERLAGLLLLFLIIPFIAGTAISGYDTSAESWPGEFDRFAGMSSRNREITAGLHGLIGIFTIVGSAVLVANFRDRSPRLITVAGTLLLAAGLVMLVNAAVYRAMSGMADDYLAGDASQVAASRSFIVLIESFSMINGTLTTSGLLALGTALVRLRMVPRWTLALPAAGAMGPILWVGLGSAFPDAGWWAIGLTFMAVALWLLFCGIWLLFGGSGRTPSMRGVPAHLG